MGPNEVVVKSQFQTKILFRKTIADNSQMKLMMLLWIHISFEKLDFHSLNAIFQSFGKKGAKILLDRKYKKQYYACVLLNVPYVANKIILGLVSS